MKNSKTKFASCHLNEFQLLDPKEQSGWFVTKLQQEHETKSTTVITSCDFSNLEIVLRDYKPPKFDLH